MNLAGGIFGCCVLNKLDISTNSQYIRKSVQFLLQEGDNLKKDMSFPIAIIHFVDL